MRWPWQWRYCRTNSRNSGSSVSLASICLCILNVLSASISPLLNCSTQSTNFSMHSSEIWWRYGLILGFCQSGLFIIFLLFEPCRTCARHAYECLWATANQWNTLSQNHPVMGIDCFITWQQYIQQSFERQPDFVPIIRLSNTLTLINTLWHNSCNFTI